jgi:hypothetical protein
MIAGRFNAKIGDQLQLGIQFRHACGNELFDPISITRVDMIDSITGSVLETITSIERLSLGTYQIVTTQGHIWNVAPKIINDKWFFIPYEGASIVTVTESTNIFAASSFIDNLPSPSFIRNVWLKGISLNDGHGNGFADIEIQKLIDMAVTQIEQKLTIDIRPRKVVCNPQPGDIYDVAESPYDYDLDNWISWGYLKLFRRPVQTVDKMSLIYPTGQTIIEIPTTGKTSWIKLYKQPGQIHLTPTAGSLTNILIGRGQPGVLPYFFMGGMTNIPQLIWMDYTTGFPNGRIPDDIAEAIGKTVAINILGIISDAITQGEANSSISADGLSLNISRTNSQNAVLYQGRIDMYNKWLTEWYKDARNYYFGCGLQII